MAVLDLSGVQVKIDRAKTHLEDIDARARAIEWACRNTVVRECDQQQRQYIFRIGQVPTIPSDFSAVVGDAIHNARSALDHLMWETVKALRLTPNVKTAFPIFDIAPTANRYGETLPNLSPQVPVDLRRILDEVQPYKRPEPANHALAILHNLDISDKHRQLLTTVIGIASVHWWSNNVVDIVEFNPGPYHSGDVVARFSYTHSDSQAQFDPAIAFSIILNEPSAGARRTFFATGRAHRELSELCHG